MKNTFSILLSLLLLLSSFEFTYAQHFSGDEVVADAFMVGEQQLGCNNYEVLVNSKETKPECCKDIYHQVNTDDDFQPSTFGNDLHIEFISSYVSAFLAVGTIPCSTSSAIFTEYLPPPIHKDITVFYQSFLI